MPPGRRAFLRGIPAAACSGSTPNAIHAATAMLSGASGMLTNDKQLRVLSHTELSIWFFDDLLQQGA